MPGRRTSDDRHVPRRAKPVSSDPARRRRFRTGKSSGAQFFASSCVFLRRFEIYILYADQTVKTGEGTSPRHCYVYTRKRGARHNTSQIQEQAVPSNICFQIVLFSRRISNLSCLSDVGLFFRVFERNRTTLMVSEMVMYCGSFVISKVRTEVGEQIDV